MMILICYDVMVTHEAGTRRLRQVSKICKNYGQRVQFSVFECIVTPADYIYLKEKLKQTIDHETDSLRFYLLGKNWQKSVEMMGKIKSYDPEKDTFAF